ncbi:plasmid replication initiator protein [Micromonospora craniellae]|uniref:Plasmid replication initiator protein n=1 Tax=Micromonospora craniellae TaxID=2294034 RepID=A0A372G3P2_9ACTN|nr:replication initiator [Micromonospora craniellae]QOC92841.1 plasmid replication initiator protein [Micromonospora craniellae]RFS47622.1 plasmid replication initiator protein [Micromonospora craniellae]
MSTLHRPGVAAGRDAQALHRAATPDYFGWLEHTRTAGGCARPVRLTGTMTAVDRDTGRVLGEQHTDELPDRVLYKACGNRRAAQCADCSWVYAGDAFQVVRCGLTGGKTVPATVARHPVVFATFTAPSFGPVHHRHVPLHTCADRRRCDCRPAPCHARRDAVTCPHGRPGACFARHDGADPQLGRPLCLDCYDHDHQVVWNVYAGELWRRTKQAIERHLAALCRRRGVPRVEVVPDAGRIRRVPPVRVSHGKVAEMQRRGAVHFHVLLRLDGVDPGDRHALVPPPAGITVDDLDTAVHAAARQIVFATPPHPDRPQGWPIAWGEQVDVRRIGTGDGDVTDARVAAYLAKYATKATEVTGHCSTRLTPGTVDACADPEGDHLARLIDACWRLGRPTRHRTSDTAAQTEDRQGDLDTTHHPYAGLRRWAHMLGYGGHFLTKARRYSVTFGLLRDTRATYRRADDGSVSVGTLAFVGSGWLTDGDALLANTAAAQHRERRRVGREELAHELWSGVAA